MPFRERDCNGCGGRYEVLLIGSRPAIRVSDGALAVCPECGAEGFRDVPNTSFFAVGLGGDAGVGKFYPYYDRGLGVGKNGRGVLVRDAAHRRHLLHYDTQGRKRDAPLIPVDSDSGSAKTGTWDDIADRHQAEKEKDAAVYGEFVKELQEGPNKESYHKVKEHIAAKGVTVAS